MLTASYAFYMAGGWRAVFYIAFITVLTYSTGLVMGKVSSKRIKKAVVAATLFICFGMLFVLLHWNYVMFTFLSSDRFMLNLIVPLGISFFTFQAVGYVIDVYRAKHTPETNIAKYALFISFFPQVLQGPINRFHHLAPQLYDGANFDAANIKYGIQLAMWGYFKILVIAARTNVIVDTVYAHFYVYDGAVIAFGALMYGIQLYCNFSGGIDIVRGIAKMFGIDMEENFRRPLFSISLADFWRRWHITLGTWLKDYLFFPLALSKPIVTLGLFTRKVFKGQLGKVIPTSICTLVIYLVVGIWHGVNLRFIAFGVYNGAVITASLLFSEVFKITKAKLRINDKSWYWRLFSILRTGLIVSVGWYIIRAPRLMYGLSMMLRTVSDFRVSSIFDGTLLTLGATSFNIAVIFVAMAVVAGVELYQENGGQVRKDLEKSHFILDLAAIAAPLAVIIFLGMWGYTEPYIYGQP